MNDLENKRFFLPFARQISKLATDEYDGFLESIIIALFVDMSNGHACKKINEQERLCLLTYPKIVTLYTGEETCVTPLVIMNELLYLHRYFVYEQRIAKQIQARCALPAKPLKIAPQTHHELDFQHLAQTMALCQNFSMITGGPGTGKTTTVLRLILQALEDNPTLEIALCAPTGKAQSRMKESVREELEKQENLTEKLKLKVLNIPSYTLHRLLGYQFNSTIFKFNAENHLPYQMIIVDECSMISLAMMSSFLDALSLETQVIFLGDKEQLPSVEAGSLFSDLCALAEANVFPPEWAEMYQRETHSLLPVAQRHLPLNGHLIELQKNYRFKNDESIGIMAKMIKSLTDEQSVKKGLNLISHYCDGTSFSRFDLLLLREKLNFFLGEKLFLIDGQKVSFSHLMTYVQEGSLNALEKIFKLIDDFKILSAVRQGEYGVDSLNDFVKKSLKMSGSLPLGAPVMIRENAPKINLFNGDIGVVWRDALGEKKLFFRDGQHQFRSFAFAQLPAHNLCFAMTIHQAQGSGFNFVFTVLPRSECLTRELVYTALTRAKKRFVLLSQKETLALALKSKVQRDSGLAMRIVNSSANKNADLC